MKHCIRILLIASAVISGCKVGPTYKQPELKAPRQWATTLHSGETNSAMTEVQWWKSFHDPELESLIARATQSNLTLRLVQARVREARESIRLVYAGLGPTLDARTSYTRTRYPKNGFPPFPPGTPLDANIYDTGFDAAWELDVFGGVRRGVEVANATAMAVEFERRNTLITLYAEIARNYVDKQAYQQRIRVAQENIEAQRNVVNLTSNLFTHGLANELDLEQARSLLATTESEVPALETVKNASIYHIAVLLGLPPASLLQELSRPTNQFNSPPTIPIGLPSDLLRRRPDVRQAERQLAAATARIGVATADLFPKFSLTGDIGLQSISAADWFTAGSSRWNFMPSIRWRIFDAGRIRANIRVQNARQEQALANYEQTALSAFEDVETALTAYANERTRRESLLEAVAANKRALKLAQDLYANGLTDFLRVLESQRAVYQVEAAEIESERAIHTDLIALYKALGGGWETEEPMRTAGARK